MSDDYWGFVITLIFLMFVIYISGRGELGIWVGLLFYTPPAKAAASTPSSGGGGGSGSQNDAGTNAPTMPGPSGIIGEVGRVLGAAPTIGGQAGSAIGGLFGSARKFLGL